MFYVPLIAFLLFNGVDYYLTSVQHNNLENRKNYYLDVMRLEGGFSLELENKIITELNSMGFENVAISATTYGGGDLSTYGDYIYRNIDNPTESRMILQIEAEPNFRPFILGRLLGVNEDETFKFVVKGEALSERPYY